MAQEIADGKLIDTWGSSGTKIEPDISKTIEGWQLGEQPPHEYMNWLQNTFGSKLNHILKNGIAKWNNETEYLAGSSVQHSGNVWIGKITNINSEPTDLNANWEKVAISKDLTLPVDTIADLKNISYPANTVWASGYHTKNDGAFGSHIFRLKGVKTTETDNGGTVIIATIVGVDYVYELQYDGAVNVKWFGAVGDGVIDNTFFIQSALDNNTKVFFPAGTYLISNTLDISDNDLIGEVFDTWRDSYITCIKAAAGFSGNYLLKQTAYNKLSLEIKNLFLDGNSVADGIWFVYTVGSRLDNILIKNIAVGIKFGINSATAGSQFNILTNVTVAAATDTALYATNNYFNKNEFNQCWFEGVNYGVNLAAFGGLCAGNIFKSCEFIGDTCVYVSSTVQNLTILNGYFEGFARIMETVSPYAEIILENCQVGIQKTLTDNCLIKDTSLSRIIVNNLYIYDTLNTTGDVYVVKSTNYNQFPYRQRIQINDYKYYNGGGNNNILKHNYLGNVIESTDNFRITEKLEINYTKDDVSPNVFTINKSVTGNIASMVELIRFTDGCIQYGFSTYKVSLLINARDTASPYVYGGYIDLIIGQNSNGVPIVTELVRTNIRNFTSFNYYVTKDGNDMVISCNDTTRIVAAFSCIVKADVNSTNAIL